MPLFPMIMLLGQVLIHQEPYLSMDLVLSCDSNSCIMVTGIWFTLVHLTLCSVLYLCLLGCYLPLSLMAAASSIYLLPHFYFDFRSCRVSSVDPYVQLQANVANLYLLFLFFTC